MFIKFRVPLTIYYNVLNFIKGNLRQHVNESVKLMNICAIERKFLTIDGS